jgi:MFS family permease
MRTPKPCRQPSRDVFERTRILNLLYAPKGGLSILTRGCDVVLTALSPDGNPTPATSSWWAGVLHGLAPILTAESVPTKFRYSGAGISYSLSAIIGGMFAPSVLAGLIGSNVAQKWLYVPVVCLVYCILAMLALLFIRETRDVNLEALDALESQPATARQAGA